jgi:hypothetical protein
LIIFPIIGVILAYILNAHINKTPKLWSFIIDNNFLKSKEIGEKLFIPLTIINLIFVIFVIGGYSRTFLSPYFLDSYYILENIEQSLILGITVTITIFLMNFIIFEKISINYLLEISKKYFLLTIVQINILILEDRTHI